MEQPRSPIAARLSNASVKSAVVHATSDWLKEIRNGEHEFFARLIPFLASKGFSCRVVDARSAASKMLVGQNNINIMVGDIPGYGANILHVMPSHIWGFWYMDEIGVSWHSSIRLARFHPADINHKKATYFFNGVSGHMLRENVSLIAQEPRVASPMEPASAVIYCQDIENHRDRCHFLTTEEMIRTAAELRRDMRVYVKMDPNQGKVARRLIMKTCQDYTHVELSEASNHDLTAASDVVITQNAGAGFEALM